MRSSCAGTSVPGMDVAIAWPGFKCRIDSTVLQAGCKPRRPGERRRPCASGSKEGPSRP
ncbi:hypothetical protein OH687_35480 [Burkholderia anthina]|nr:hypothetical protein OH687_35480 [Burkholderia anthina]